MSMREQYENLDQYAAYDYKDVVNAYGHGEWDAIDKVLEVINDCMREGSVPILGSDNYADIAIPSRALKNRILLLKEGEQ